MKLFVFPEFHPGYYKGVAFAIADDIADAKSQIMKKTERDEDMPLNWGPVEMHDLSEKYAFYLYDSD